MSTSGTSPNRETTSNRRHACLARFEPDADSTRTHTCDLLRDHDGDHHCPVCGKLWDKPLFGKPL